MPLPRDRDRNAGRGCCTDDELRDIARRKAQYCQIPNQPQRCESQDSPNTLWRKKYHFDQCIQAREDENRCKGNDPGHDEQVLDLTYGRDRCQTLIVDKARHGAF